MGGILATAGTGADVIATGGTGGVGAGGSMGGAGGTVNEPQSCEE
jgi:hypothetical protein